jgi:hypothetical protein
MSCFRRLSSAGASSISTSLPSTRRRWNPAFFHSAISRRYSPFRPRTTGLSSMSRVPSGSAITRSTIWLTVCALMGRPVAGE